MWNIVADAIKRALIQTSRQLIIKTQGHVTRPMRKVVYGRTRVGATVRYIESSGTDSNIACTWICIFATHMPAQILRRFILMMNWLCRHNCAGKYSGKAEMIFETGKQASANAAIVAATPSGWTSSHELLGHTYAYIKLTYDMTFTRACQM